MLIRMKECQQHGLFYLSTTFTYFCVVCGESLSKVMVVREFHAAFSSHIAVISLFVFISIIKHRWSSKRVALPRSTAYSAGKRIAPYGGSDHQGQAFSKTATLHHLEAVSTARVLTRLCGRFWPSCLFSLSLSFSLCWLSCFFFSLLLLVAPHWARRDDIGHPSSRDNTYSPD